MRQTQETKRCAVYTRKSTDERLDAEFNSLDAQYDACSAYIKSQVGMGWRLMDKKYDDGGYSGGTMNRPALSELIGDIKAGKIDVVVVYKIDRLSRSLCDFTDLSKLFEQHNVSFVSVTQQIDTSNAAGRMMLNILMSFAQFEREMTADRIRDKIYASRKRGMWTGGPTPYGYVLEDKQLKVDAKAAEVVRWIFRRYIATGSSMQVAKDLNDSPNRRADGQPWRPRMVLAILKNRVYTGKLCIKRTGELFDGRHEAIIDEKQFEAAQKALDENRCYDGKTMKHTMFAPLKGILRCGSCGGSMTPVFSNYSKAGGRRRYVYYRCTRDAKNAERSCPIRSIAADVIEKFVYTQLGSVLRRDDIRALVCNGNPSLEEAYQVETSDMERFWGRMVPTERERLLLLLVREVRLFPEKVEIDLAIEGDDGKIVVPARLKRNLGRAKIVVASPGGDGEEPAADGDLAVVRALRKCHKWADLLTTGTYHDKKALADALGLSNSYLGKMLRLAYLSPRIVEAIMLGELPSISVTKLQELDTPIWEEQERQLGFGK